jgi:hypothetical protein
LARENSNAHNQGCFAVPGSPFSVDFHGTRLKRFPLGMSREGNRGAAPWATKAALAASENNTVIAKML